MQLDRLREWPKTLYFIGFFCYIGQSRDNYATSYLMKEKVRINQQIRVPELRVVDEEEGNLGVLPIAEALRRAQAKGLDLIEISPTAIPPIAKIMDYGRFQYITQKKERDAKSKAHITETKTVQVKIGTSERDLELKAKKSSEWLKEGHRVKLDLFLPGRTKYMDPKFLEARLERMLKLISEEYKVAESPKKSLKGLTIVIEKAVGVKKKEPQQSANQPAPMQQINNHKRNNI